MKNPCAHLTARATAHQTARQQHAATAAPHGRTPQFACARVRTCAAITHPITHAGLTHVCAYPCGGVRPCAPAACAGCGRALWCAPPVRSPVRALFTHAHIQKKEREMDKKRAKAAIAPDLCHWMALPIPSHRAAEENAKNGLYGGLQP